MDKSQRKAPQAFGDSFCSKSDPESLPSAPFSETVAERYEKYFEGCHIGRFIEIWSKNDIPGISKQSELQHSHNNIAIFNCCPKSPKWWHMVPKGLQNESLGLPKCSKVEPSGPQDSPGMPKVRPNVQKDHLGKLPGMLVGPKVAQVPSRAPFLSGF